MHQLTPEREAAADRALAVLTGRELEPVVDMVVWAHDGGYEARSHDGSVRFERREPDSPGPGDAVSAYEVVATTGSNPLADQRTDRLAPLAAELAELHPHRSANAYPFAYDHIAQLFDHPAAPDLCVIHSAGHNWEDQGGHRGEHGSLGVVQARAPFVLAGAGVAQRGLVPRALRVVDIAPTLAALLGCRHDEAAGFLEGQDGVVVPDLIDEGAGRPEHVIGFLFDGTNANVLYAMAAAGEAPNVARLIGMGTAFEHGAIAALPTITLANHTSILTGRLPGHHGILNNAWYDRATGVQVITNSSATWATAMDHATAGLDSLHRAVHRSFPDAFTASVNEPCDIGADYSTFDFFRRGEIPPIPQSPEGLPHSTERFVRPSKDYSWGTVVDHMGVEQAVGILSGRYRDVTYPIPKFLWVNFTLTDSAMHEGGPHSEVAAASIRDSDARLGEVLTAVERAGSFDRTAFVLVADHGMEETDPAVRGDWGPALRDAGIAFRDEAYSFLYLDEA
ncbi:MAG: type phosphodiesterase/nucleotide pyrophosphatase [Actinomycetia bacterium]|nr:type phosphodiesterase/nucleotide pyrophosphatase [Actinomycetes bacterium]